jgi:NAD(P)H-hydrate epimerase
MTRLTRAQLREVDRRAIEEFGIPGIVLMENAARAVAEVAYRAAQRAQIPETLVLCGGGNNGGDGLAVARHLHNRRVPVKVGLTTDPARYAGDALTNWRIVQSMKLPIIEVSLTGIIHSGCLTVVDAIFGTGLSEPPRKPFDEITLAVHLLGAEVIAVDVPSGLDCDTGKPLGDACIEASITVTFVAQKVGFANEESEKYTGEIIVADIGCPRELIEPTVT